MNDHGRSGADLRGRHAVVTGATSGIGSVVACDLARLGADVTLLGRDAVRGQVALEAVREAGRIAGHAGGDHRLVLADFADLSSVVDAAGAIGERGVIDALINNAGLISGRRVLTVDGNELSFQVNHLAHFLLTNLLLDHLLAARSARVVTVSSDAHLRAWSGIRFGDLTYERGYDPFGAYAHAKLANILFAYELARRTEGTTVTSSAVHPGVVRTGFGRGWQDPFGIVWKLLSPLWLTPERGADSVTYVASAAQLEGVTGRYYYRRRPRRSSPASNNETAAASLWGVSLELTGLA